MYAPRQVTSEFDRLMITAEFPHLTPAQLFDHFTVPELLAHWWAPQAEVDGRVGGAYHFIWLDMDYHLRGTYGEFKPGERLAFTWHWDHEPDSPVRHVEVEFMALGDGSRLRLTHGFYTPEDAQERMGHLDGWMYFLPLLYQPDESEGSE